jgi:cytidylate kinase
MIVAIDGPAASGKSTAAIGVAKALNITHLDTGAMYRAITYGLLKNKIEFTDLDAVEAFLEGVDLKFFKKDNVTKLLLNDSDITENIRSNNINENVSEVSAIKIVREFMVKYQREMSDDIDCVLEGRDIGTVVFPNADFKFFIIASDEARANRRLDDLIKVGDKNPGDFEIVLEELILRDHKDSTRDHSPLKKADDAIEIDTTHLTINEVVNKIVNTVNQKRTLY